MTIEEAFGEVVRDSLPGALKLPMAIAVWHAVDRHRDFTFVEARIRRGQGGYLETLVVDSQNDAVPSRNHVGILYREPLALTFYEADRLPEVYTLRADFPFTSRQNDSPKSGYKNPCLYVDPWSALRRTWTARKHLDRILWWLAATASGTLHRPDQPVEQLYFESPYRFVVPPDLPSCIASGTHELIVEGRESRHSKRFTLVGRVTQVGTDAPARAKFACVALQVPPVVHGTIEPTPRTLGELHDQLVLRGSSLTPLLIEAIKARCIDGKFPGSTAEDTLLVLNLPLKRDAKAEVERTDLKGFVVHTGPAELGAAVGALEQMNLKGKVDYWAIQLIAGKPQANKEWRRCEITAVEVVEGFTSAMARRANGIVGEGPKGVVAGAGALGSEIFDLWARSGWGTWIVIDPDQIRPHNLARHRASERHVGFDKALVMSIEAAALTAGEPPRHAAIIDAATNLANKDVASALETAEFVVDVTTTLEFPRDLAVNDNVRRAVSVFVTPSGRGAVMLLEDAKRTLRLDGLEAQYYRRVISAPWGVDHLAGNRGHLWTGAGCRDVSAVIPNEYVRIHGANLASMIRTRVSGPAAALIIWRYDATQGSLTVDECAPAVPLRDAIGGLDVIWDEDIRAKIRRLREEHFPNETGGVLLGYFDLALKRVFVVDALQAPPDSKGEADGFVRGVSGLEELVNAAQQRTGHIVGYVGEWHSHPPNHSSLPSGDDLLLLGHLAVRLSEDGQPALMLIVGEAEERWLTAVEIISAAGE